MVCVCVCVRACDVCVCLLRGPLPSLYILQFCIHLTSKAVPPWSIVLLVIPTDMSRSCTKWYRNCHYISVYRGLWWCKKFWKRIDVIFPYSDPAPNLVFTIINVLMTVRADCAWRRVFYTCRETCHVVEFCVNISGCVNCCFYLMYNRLYINKIQQDATVCRYLFTAKPLYIFRVSIAPIIRST